MKPVLSAFVAYIGLKLILSLLILCLLVFPNVKVTPEKATKLFNDNYQYYSEVVINFEQMTKKEEGFHKLPKECRFLTQSGDIKVVKENGFYAYEFILRSNLGGAEYLYFTPVDKPPYEKGDLYYEDHEIMKLKDNWYFVGSY